MAAYHYAAVSVLRRGWSVLAAALAPAAVTKVEVASLAPVALATTATLGDIVVQTLRRRLQALHNSCGLRGKLHAFGSNSLRRDLDRKLLVAASRRPPRTRLASRSGNIPQFDQGEPVVVDPPRIVSGVLLDPLAEGHRDLLLVILFAVLGTSHDFVTDAKIFDDRATVVLCPIDCR